MVLSLEHRTIQMNPGIIFLHLLPTLKRHGCMYYCKYTTRQNHASASGFRPWWQAAAFSYTVSLIWSCFSFRVVNRYTFWLQYDAISAYPDIFHHTVVTHPTITNQHMRTKKTCFCTAQCWLFGKSLIRKTHRFVKHNANAKL